MKIEKGDNIGGFYDNGAVTGFIYGEVCKIDEFAGHKMYLVSGMKAKAKHSGDWYVREKDILIHIKSVFAV